MRFKTIIALLLLCPTLLSAQYKLSGIIGMQGGDLFSYDIVAQDTKDPNVITGTVKTYATKSQEVTAEVELNIDREAKKVSLRETKIIGNTGFKSNTIICLVRSELTYDETNGVLKGPILTQTSGDQAYCARGNVIFTNRSEIEALFQIKKEIKPQSPVPPPVASIPTPRNEQKPTTPKTKPAPIVDPIITPNNPKPVAIKPMEITEGKDQAIEWTSDKVIIEVWDNNQIDGDRVTIKANGETIADNLLLSSNPAKFVLDISSRELSVIVITAMSEGSEPPNTAMLKLTDNNKEHLILSHNEIGKTSLVRIKRKL